LSFCSAIILSIWYTRASNLFLDSTISLFFLSSSANFSPSAFACAISSSEIFVDPWIFTSCDLPVDFSCAVTWRIPFASISKVTSI